MRILDEQDNEIQESDVDFEKGHLEQDWYCIAHHPEVPSSGPITHFETQFYFDDGTDVWLKEDEYKVDVKADTYIFNDDKLNSKTVVGIDGRQVEDQPYIEGQREWFENEEILRYKLYTEGELQLIEARKKQQEAEAEERDAKDAEYKNLLSSMDDVILAVADNESSSSELEDKVDDIILALADLIGE